MKTIFPIKEVNDLRDKAVRARQIPELGIDGWSISHVSPMELLNIFPTLQLKPGYKLEAYLYRSGSDGNGIVWAVPADSILPSPDDCVRLDSFLSPPKPSLAIEDFREAIEGDGSPWSYLSASLFAREAWEFGVLWHGCHWSDQRILGQSPWFSEDRPSDPRFVPSEETRWIWEGKKPAQWEPTFELDNDRCEISLHIYSGLERETITLLFDRYKQESYVFDQERIPLAYGEGGFIY